MSAPRIVTSGLAGGCAYLVAQALDMKIARNRLDDRVLLGRLLPVPMERARAAGTAIHLGNSFAASAAYHRLAVDRLRGPGWWRGLQFALAECLALYPLAALERLHPAIRHGELSSYRNRVAFAQQVWRHLAFGAVLGLAHDWRRRP